LLAAKLADAVKCRDRLLYNETAFEKLPRDPYTELHFFLALLDAQARISQLLLSKHEQQACGDNLQHSTASWSQQGMH
jgi:hypothetical protein